MSNKWWSLSQLIDIISRHSFDPPSLSALSFLSPFKCVEGAVKHEQEAKSQRFLKEAMNKLAALYILETCIVLETKWSTAQDNAIKKQQQHRNLTKSGFNIRHSALFWVTVQHHCPQFVWAAVWMWCSWCLHQPIDSPWCSLCVTFSQAWRDHFTLSGLATHR